MGFYKMVEWLIKAKERGYKMKKQWQILIVLSLICSMSLVGCSSTKEVKVKYPEKPITIHVGYAAGGGTDLMAREIGKYITKKTGQPVVVVNQPGGGGSIAIGDVAQKAPDGYELAFMTNGALLVNPQLNNLGFTYEKDITPLALVSTAPLALAVRADSKFKTLEELLEYAKANPNKITYASGGQGSTGQLVIEDIAIYKGGIKFNFLPNTNIPQSLAELLGGHIDAYSINIATFKENYEAKKIRVLAVSAKERLKDFPDVPTYEELGYKGTETYNPLFGFVGPANMPAEIVNTLDELFKGACEDPEVIAGFNKINYGVAYLNSKDFKVRLDNDIKVLSNILQTLGMKK